MGKSSKAETDQRVQEVLKLTLAGAEFPEIQQFARQQGWDVSERQLRRYIECAYRDVAQLSERDTDQIKGRQLMQRRVLFARAMKLGDIRTALSILQDEAKLLGLYPPTKIAPTTPDGKQPYTPFGISTIPRRERVVQLLAAECNEDLAQQKLLEQVSPRLVYTVADTLVPLQMLNTMCLIYVCEQLEFAGTVVHALWCATIDPEHEEFWTLTGCCSAYRFRIGEDAWREFTDEFDIDADALVRQNHCGQLLNRCAGNIRQRAPSEDEMRLLFEEDHLSTEQLLTTEDLSESWREMFLSACRQ